MFLPDGYRLGDLDFADNIALIKEEIASSDGGSQTRSGQSRPLSKCRKSNVMHIGDRDTVNGTVVEPRWLEKVEKFMYLGSIIYRNGDAETDVKYQIGKVSAVFQKVQNIWSWLKISLKIKLIFASVVIAIAIYTSES